MKEFTHLHVHTEYSLLDGATRISKLFDVCKENNMKSVAITDHGVMFGVKEFYEAGKKAGVKPILGCELYMCSDMQQKKAKSAGEFEHIVLLAKNQTGYKNLVKLVSEAYVKGFYYKPRIDMQLLKQHTEGLICLSACLAGGVPQLLMRGDYDGAKKLAIEFRDMFAKGDYYIELQDHGIREQKMILPDLKRLAREIDVKMVATNDVHYLRKQDAEAQDVLLCIQTQKTLDDPNRMKFETNEFYLKNYDEMYELFSDVPEALDITNEIADKCDAIVETKLKLLPNYIPPDNLTPPQYLKKLTEEGLKKRYPTITQEIRERTDYEFNTIEKMGFVEYYLIVWDFINYARVHGIPVGPGRGSGVGSIVAYAIGITDLDPLKYSLLFERFLNSERVSMPDFDIDFCYEGRGQVIEYVRNKYGKDNVAQIVTFGRMKAKAALKDVARVYKMPYNEVDAIAKLFPEEPKAKLENIFGVVRSDKHPEFTSNELAEKYNSDLNVKRVVDMAICLENMPRNTSMHAAGVVICNYPLSDYVPLLKSGDDVIIQFNMIEAEEIGLLKMDFLGLRTLTDIKYAIEYAEQTTGKRIDFDTMGTDDVGVYELIGSGETDAVFQLESAGMKKFMRELKPTSLEDIIAGVSLYRPGPMDSIPKYIEGKKFPENIVYKHESLEEFLNVTYGCIVYQEQVMQIVQKLAGFSLGQADIIRRVMSKKKADQMKVQREIFLNGEKDENGNVKIVGAIANGIPENAAGSIFDEMESFASYAFNKSHATAYAYLSYQTAYLKKYHPVEFLASVLNNRITNSDEIVKYASYAREKNIKVLPPDINKSQVKFSVENGAIRFGLAAVKGVGEAVMSEILKVRKEKGSYKSLDDFFDKVDTSLLNKRLMENMIKAGAFDCFGYNRAQLMAIYEQIMSRHASDKKKRAEGQFSFFDIMPDEVMKSLQEIDCSSIQEYKTFDKLVFEKDVLGVYVSGHPLDEFKAILKDTTFNTGMIPLVEEDNFYAAMNDAGIANDKRITIGGIILSHKRILTKKGDEMGFIQFEDMYGGIELIAFPKVFEKIKSEIYDDTIVIVDGVLLVKKDEPVKISVQAIRALNSNDETSKKDKVEPAAEVAQKNFTVYLNAVEKSESQIQDVLDILNSYKGENEVVIKKGNGAFKVPVKVNYCKGLEIELNARFKKEQIVVK